MNTISLRGKAIVRLFSIMAFITVLAALHTAHAATEITGTITAKRADTVKVEFEPKIKAGPKIGDLVDFKTVMQGLEVNAGHGEVTESASGSVWVKIKNGRPNLKMTALIQATGTKADNLSPGGDTGYEGSDTAQKERDFPTANAAEFKQQILQKAKYDRKPRWRLGVGIRENVIDPDSSDGTIRGARVVYVVENSPAQKGGIKKGDIIYAINNVELTKATQVVLFVSSSKDGILSVELDRNGSKKNFKIELEEMD